MSIEYFLNEFKGALCCGIFTWGYCLVFVRFNNNHSKPKNSNL